MGDGAGLVMVGVAFIVAAIAAVVGGAMLSLVMFTGGGEDTFGTIFGGFVTDDGVPTVEPAGVRSLLMESPDEADDDWNGTVQDNDVVEAARLAVDGDLEQPPAGEGAPETERRRAVERKDS